MAAAPRASSRGWTAGRRSAGDVVKVEVALRVGAQADGDRAEGEKQCDNIGA